MMKLLKADSDLPWICIGDLNEVLCREQQLGEHERPIAQIEPFRETVNICGLCDIEYI